MKKVYFYDYDVIRIGIAQTNDKISNVFFENEKDMIEFEIEETSLISKAALQIHEYLLGARTEFNLPLELIGTEFQKSVWRGLLSIPYGETRSYKEIATLIGNPKACRAVGMANNRNPIAIIVPCHRVIGQDGSLIGYAGGLEVKKYLLDLEKRNV